MGDKSRRDDTMVENNDRRCLTSKSRGDDIVVKNMLENTRICYHNVIPTGFLMEFVEKSRIWV